MTAERGSRAHSIGLSDIRWFPILACALAADADLWYSVSTGTNEGDYIGIGFFGVFAVGAIRRWRLGGDRFHLITSAGAVVALGAMAFRKSGRFDPAHVLSYLAFLLSCVLGSILSRCLKRGKRA